MCYQCDITIVAVTRYELAPVQGNQLVEPHNTQPSNMPLSQNGDKTYALLQIVIKFDGRIDRLTSL